MTKQNKTNMKLLKNPWESEFLELVREAKDSIRILSPYIKENNCNKIIDIKQNQVIVEIITALKLANLYSGSLDKAEN